jgi:hypothetical protein
LGKMPTTRARRLISLLTRSKGFVLQTLGQCARGNAVTAKTSTLAVSIRVPIFREPAGELVTHSCHVAAAFGSGWAKIVRNTAATMSVCVLGTCANRLRAEWTRQRWWAVP